MFLGTRPTLGGRMLRLSDARLRHTHHTGSVQATSLRALPWGGSGASRRAAGRSGQCGKTLKALQLGSVETGTGNKFYTILGHANFDTGFHKCALQPINFGKVFGFHSAYSGIRDFSYKA